MSQKQLVSTSKNSSSVKDYLDDSIVERRWQVCYTNKVSFFLTDSERKHFLREIAGGARIVQVGDLTLTATFLYIYPIRDLPKEKKWEEVTGSDGVTYMREVL